MLTFKFDVLLGDVEIHQHNIHASVSFFFLAIINNILYLQWLHQLIVIQTFKRENPFEETVTLQDWDLEVDKVMQVK